MPIPGAGGKIRSVLLSWPGISAHPHQFGATEYRLGKRQIGHVHGDHLVDIPFPRKIRDELVATGRAKPHHIHPESGWISFYIRGENDVDAALELMRLSFNHAQQQKSRQDREQGNSM
ncbi:MAG: DUF5519 family protein [Acidobacteria bacterium]|nr:DUF5519 family protein [Acidobacteriota bacterium]